MILEVHELDRTLPDDFGEPESVWVDERRTCGHSYILLRIPEEELLSRRGKEFAEVAGMPVYFSIGKLLRFWPMPDKAYHVKFYYIPKMKEW